LTALPASAAPTSTGPGRRIAMDQAKARDPLDRFFNDCVGSDYPGTLYRPDTLSAAQDRGR
jgi:xylan 1,4-beta-xylosidase